MTMTQHDRALKVLNDNENATIGERKDAQGTVDAVKHEAKASGEGEETRGFFVNENDVLGRDEMSSPLVAKHVVKHKAQIGFTETENVYPGFNEESLNEAERREDGSSNQIVAHHNSGSSDSIRDDVAAGGEVTMNKQQRMVEIETTLKPTPALAVDKNDKGGKNEPPKKTPASLASDKSQEHSATLVVKHVRGYFARTEMARMIHRIKFTSVAHDAAAAARDVLRSFGEPAQSSGQPTSGNLFDLTCDGTAESCLGDNVSLSTINGEDALADTPSSSLKPQECLSNQLPSNSGDVNELSLEIMRSMVLSSEEEDGDDESVNEDHGSGSNFANLFADGEITYSSSLFENGLSDKAAGMKPDATRTVNHSNANPPAFCPWNGAAFSCSKNDSLRGDASQSSEIKSKEQNSSTEYDSDTTDGTIMYLGTFSKERVQADLDKTRAEEKARIDHIGELESIFREWQTTTDLEQHNQLLEKELLRSKHMLSGETSPPKESRSLFLRQLSNLKAKHSTTLSEKLVAETKVKYLLKEKAHLSAQVLEMKQENETLVLQKLAAEAKTEWVNTKLVAAVFGWIQLLLLLLVLGL